MEPILKTVASEYALRYSDLKKICFLFPNKRCGVFFKKYLAEEGVSNENLPHILTISEFVGQISRLTEAPRIQQLFTLFDVYRNMLNSQSESNTEEEIAFEDFRSWGETVLSDFNIVDQYLVNPDEIFKNVKDYREIASNFLTDEQKEVMSEYFGVDDTGDNGKFWKTFKDFENLPYLQKRFINLWQIMAPLHKRFIHSLEKDGLGTSGNIYRKAASMIEERGKYAIPYKKIITVGFNALTESERSIFKNLQKEKGYEGYDNFIDFIWDATGPILSNSSFTASRFVDYNKKQFPEPDWLKPGLQRQEVKEFPGISIIAAPSLTSQTKIAGELLQAYRGEEGETLLNNAEVALILPDETLLTNMLFSFPDNMKSINLTMSYNLRNTPVASFLNLLRRLYATMRETGMGNVFYVRDLRMLFTHPYSFLWIGEETIDSIKNYVDENRKVSLSSKEIDGMGPNKGFFNFPSKKSEIKEIFMFLKNVLDKIIENIGDEGKFENEKEQIKIYQEYLAELEEAMHHYKVKTSPLTVMHIVDRLVGAEKIGFEGEPLSGLQVMGTLESRSLDFRHVIILSMNEGVMPRRAMTSTFIPESLRKAYGLPPARYAEEIFAYYFYRLISRAKKVSLIYDGRTLSGLRGGESRYLLQLRQYVPSELLQQEAWQFPLKNRIQGDATVEKTPEIIEMIDNFAVSGRSRLNLSASSLTTYRKCQVQFFLKNILNINTDPGPSEYMDAITVGNILHEVMMDLYLPPELRGRLLDTPVVMDSEKLKSLIGNKDLIHGLVERKIKKLFFRKDENDSMRWESTATDIIASEIESQIRSILNYDLTLTPFNLYGCEIDENLRIRMDSGRIVNFRFAIDRLDEINEDGQPKLRIVDYKTGEKKRTATDLSVVFEEGKGDQIFQLFLYAWLLNKRGMKGSEDVITEIYFVPDLIKGAAGRPEIGRKKVNNYGEYHKEFNEGLQRLVEDLFSSPCFKDKSSVSTCLYCDFRSHCGK